MADLKKMYTTILGDHFPMEMKITFGDQELVYRKKTWKIVGEDGSVDERGVRYGEKTHTGIIFRYHVKEKSGSFTVAA